MMRVIHKIDATDQVLGRLASRIALILRGKNKVEFEPSADCGDIVEIINAGKIRVTGAKLTQKKYFEFSGQVGGLKTTSLKQKLAKDPSYALRSAVYNMLPDNRLRRRMIKRLKFVS